MLTDEQTHRLARLRNYATRYEVIATNDSHNPRVILAGYTARKSRAGLFAVVRSNGPLWQSLTNDDGLTWQVRAGCVSAMMGAWRFTFGRTQREAITSGEAPYVADVLTKS